MAMNIIGIFSVSVNFIEKPCKYYCYSNRKHYFTFFSVRSVTHLHQQRNNMQSQKKIIQCLETVNSKYQSTVPPLHEIYGQFRKKWFHLQLMCKINYVHFLKCQAHQVNGMRLFTSKGFDENWSDRIRCAVKYASSKENELLLNGIFLVFWPVVEKISNH